MTSKTVAQLLMDLGIVKSHSRPRVSDDNAFSEAQFKTLKYHHSFPGTFESAEDARKFLGAFFDWYNHDHKHSGIELFSPADVQLGKVEELRQRRQQSLDAAFRRHPERFSKPPVARVPSRPSRLGPDLANLIELPVRMTEAVHTNFQEAM